MNNIAHNEILINQESVVNQSNSSTDIVIDDKQVIYKDVNGDFVFNLMKDFKVDDKQIKSLVVIGLKTAQDYRKTADILKGYMAENKITNIVNLNVELDSSLFDRLFRQAVRFNDEALALSAINGLSIEDYTVLAKLLNNTYLAFFR